MFKLCVKDYLSSRWLWLATSAMFVLYIIQPLGSSALLMAFVAMLLVGNQNLPLFFEDKDKTEALYSSLPLRRADIVRGRYLLAGLLLAGSGLLIFGSGAAVKALFRGQAYQNSLSPLLSLEGVAGYLLGGGFLYAAFLPLYHKLGLGRGNMVYFPGLFVLLAVAMGLEQIASRTLKIIHPLLMPEFLKDPGRGVIVAIGSIRSALGTAPFALFTIALLAALGFISLRLSIRFYERREF